MRRKMLSRTALPEGHCPQSRMRETVMSPLEMGKQERQMPLGAAGSEGPSQLGNMVGTWHTWHIVGAGRDPPKSPSPPCTNGPKLGRLQTQALPSGWGPEQTDQEFQAALQLSPIPGAGRA